jgi:hypothetical protein
MLNRPVTKLQLRVVMSPTDGAISAATDTVPSTVKTLLPARSISLTMTFGYVPAR